MLPLIMKGEVRPRGRRGGPRLAGPGATRCSGHGLSAPPAFVLPSPYRVRGGSQKKKKRTTMIDVVWKCENEANNPCTLSKYVI